MKSIVNMSGAELAAFVQSHLMKNDIDVVLSGGACVSFYNHEEQLSNDLDLVNIHFTRQRWIREAMEEIGFREEEGVFRHPDTKFFIEFPAGPLAVGNEPVRSIDEYRLSTGTLKIISPTDCIKDRLTAFYYWDDMQCLEQASLVARSRKINIEEIARWSGVEGKSEAFRKIRNRLSTSEDAKYDGEFKAYDLSSRIPMQDS